METGYLFLAAGFLIPEACRPSPVANYFVTLITIPLLIVFPFVFSFVGDVISLFQVTICI
jgi:hypothetical protein